MGGLEAVEGSWMYGLPDLVVRSAYQNGEIKCLGGGDCDVLEEAISQAKDEGRLSSKLAFSIVLGKLRSLCLICYSKVWNLKNDR